ncbi:MAG: hypothetical protein ACI9YO_002579, partial [Gammaproteobacteria bacterium]
FLLDAFLPAPTVHVIWQSLNQCIFRDALNSYS